MASSKCWISLSAAVGCCIFFVAAAYPARANDLPMRLPVDCRLGETCFVQQLPDTDPGAGAVDSFCGSATYDGHDGVDVRVRSLVDMANGIPVVAVAPGTVLRTRGSMPDALVETPQQRLALKGKECGNGLVVDLGEGLVAQYCHLRQASLTVRPGDNIRTGQTLGLVGASGLAAFPHVHLSLRRNGRKLDPATGRQLDVLCQSDGATGSLFRNQDALVRRDFTEALAIGISDRPIVYARLVEDGAPPPPVAGKGASVAYGWFINLKRGDRIRLVLKDPDKNAVSDATSLPLQSNQAVYAFNAGKRRPLTAGAWSVAATVLRDGRPVLSRRRDVTIPPPDIETPQSPD